MKRPHLALAGLGLVAVIVLVARSARARPAVIRLHPQREAVLAVARQHAAAATPYQWGGGRSPSDWGLDCSSLVIQAFRAAGLPSPPIPNSGGFAAHLPPTTCPEPGDLIFYGPGRVTHVEIIDQVKDCHPFTTIGANGGDSGTTSRQVAARIGAFVRQELFPRRKDIMGLRRLPLA
jgi:hypothetical protein